MALWDGSLLNCRLIRILASDKITFSSRGRPTLIQKVSTCCWGYSGNQHRMSPLDFVGNLSTRRHIFWPLEKIDIVVVFVHARLHFLDKSILLENQLVAISEFNFSYDKLIFIHLIVK
jgi:hypothetical protein